MDIDADVADRAAALLDHAGYGDRVQVLVADTGQGLAGEGAFDAIVVDDRLRGTSPPPGLDQQQAIARPCRR